MTMTEREEAARDIGRLGRFEVYGWTQLGEKAQACREKLDALCKALSRRGEGR